METATTFKAFRGGKSKARKGAIRYNEKLAGRLELLVTQNAEGEWGFDVAQADHMLAQMEADTAETQTDDTGEVQESELNGEATPDADPAEHETEVDGIVYREPVESGTMFAAIGTALAVVAEHALATPVTETAAIPVTVLPLTRGSYTIEKDRPEQNGIKRPSAGGLCRAVWDEMDRLREVNENVPDTKLVREAAERFNWNMNNAMIEFYQWRKYNGITGRAKKSAAIVVATPVPAEGHATATASTESDVSENCYPSM